MPEVPKRTAVGPDHSASPIVIAPYAAEHRDAFERLNRDWLTAYDLLEPADEAELQDPGCAFLEAGGDIFVALSHRDVVGTAATRPWDAATLEIAKLAVAPHLHGRGIGRQLVRACLARAHARGTSRVVLISNSRLVAARKLYESLGFVADAVPPRLAAKYATADVFMSKTLGGRAEITFVEAPPDPADYARLRASVGWDARPADAAAAGLPAALYSVCAYRDGELVACGRVVGDGALYFYIQDIIVVPAHQQQGLGHAIMTRIERYLETHAPANAFIGLMAAAGAAPFYRRYGYDERPADRPGMFKIRKSD